MGNQSTKDYRFPEKHKWRQWSWRQIKKRLWERGIRTKDAKGLYLAAESDKDRDVACRKNGFRPENLIAVEKEPATVKKLRAKKVVVIEGDIWDVLSQFSGNYLHFANLDLCNGFSTSCMNSLEGSLYTGSIPEDHPICINLLAGRDKTDMLAHFKNKYRHMFDGPIGRCHMFLTQMLLHLSIQQEKYAGKPMSDETRLATIFGMDPIFYNYRSDNKTMHSAVFNMPFTIGHHFKGLSRKELRGIPGMAFREDNHQDPTLIKMFKKQQKYEKRVVAAKAIRTQRINGTKAPSPIK